MAFTIDGTVLTKYIPEENEGDDVVIVVPDGIETIGEKAFKKWFDGRKTSITIILPETVTRIEEDAFAWISATYHFPSSLKYIGSGAFVDAAFIKIHFNGTLKEWESIDKNGENWRRLVDCYEIFCTDGDIKRYGLT